MHDFLVVGGGIAGASVAAELASHGKVRLIEMEGAGGYHSTGRSAAIFSVTYGNGTIRALSRESEAFFRSPPPGFAQLPLTQPLGRMVIGASDSEPVVAELLRDPELLPRLKVLRGREVRQLVPVLREEVAAIGVLDVTARALDVNSLLHGYLRLARQRKAETAFNCQFLAAQWSGDHWRIDTTGGAVQARILVNAAGAWAGRLADAAHVAPLPLTPLRRTALLVDAPAGVSVSQWPQVVFPGAGLYFRPDAGKLLVSPMDETPVDAGDAQPEDYDIALCVDRLETLTGISVRRVSHKWAGLRTFVPDRSPVVGYDPDAANFFWVAGLGGYGIQTAPALSRLAAAMAIGKAGVGIDSELAAAVSVRRLRTRR